MKANNGFTSHEIAAMSEQQNNLNGDGPQADGLSLRWQICFFTGVAIFLSLASLGYMVFSESRKVVEEVKLDQLASSTAAAVQAIETRLETARSDTLQIPDFPPIPGIVRCLDNDGQDPAQQGSTTEVWIERLSTILSAQMERHPERQLCSVLLKDGRELMRIEQRGGQIETRTEGLPQIASKTFQEAIKLDKGSVYVSPIVPLDGESENPSVIRFATPFFDGQREVRGVFMITMHAESVLRDATKLIKSAVTDVVDETGTYILCDESPSYQFSSRKYRQDKPIRAALLLQADSPDFHRDLIPGDQRPDGVSLVAIYQKVFYAAPQDKSRFWAIAPSINADEALRPVKELAQKSVMLAAFVLLAAIIVTFFASRGLTSAIRKLARTSDAIARGNLDAELPKIRPFGEVRMLKRSIEAMTRNMRDTIRSSNDREQRTRAILDSTADGIVIVSDQGRIISVNSAACLLFGFQMDELIGQEASIICPALQSANSHYDSEPLRPGEVRKLGDESEVDGRHKNGTQVPLALRVTQMEYSGERLFIATVQDITERRHTALERQRLFDGIREAAESLSASSSEILATTTQQSASAQQQAASVTETATTVQQLAQTAEQAAGRAREVASSAQRADEVSNSGRTAVAATITAMQGVREQVESTAENIFSAG